jgi:hypothetical protein
MEETTMKARIFALMVIVAMLFSAFGVDTARAGAYATQFTTSVTYMNVGTATTTTLKLYFYATPDDTTPTSHTLAPLAVHAAGSVFMGALDDLIVADGFRGSAYLESDQMMQVTLVQIPQNSTDVKNRALSNGFITGGPTALIATVLKSTYDYSTIFSVQNADTVLNNVTIDFVNTSAAIVHTITTPIAPGAAYYVDMGLLGALTTFNGSVVVTAKRADNSAGKVVASSMELALTGTGVYSFEGVEAGAMQLYMPSYLCAKYNASSSYAVQNTSLTASTSVTVTYTAIEGGTYSQTLPIGPGAKASFIACNAAPANTYGAAVVTSTVTPVVAIGKVYGGGFSTAFLGVAVGSQVMGLPYVRWATDANYNAGLGQRTFITIQNVGSPLVETEEVDIEYYDYAGNLAATHTYVVPAGGLATGAKFNSNASLAGLLEFGIYGSIYGGAVIIRGPAGSELAAIGRVQTYVVSTGLFVGEDYNSQPIR